MCCKEMYKVIKSIPQSQKNGFHIRKRAQSLVTNSQQFEPAIVRALQTFYPFSG